MVRASDLGGSCVRFSPEARKIFLSKSFLVFEFSMFLNSIGISVAELYVVIYHLLHW